MGQKLRWLCSKQGTYFHLLLLALLGSPLTPLFEETLFMDVKTLTARTYHIGLDLNPL